jgi:hypothetical protein
VSGAGKPCFAYSYQAMEFTMRIGIGFAMD